MLQQLSEAEQIVATKTTKSLQAQTMQQAAVAQCAKLENLIDRLCSDLPKVVIPKSTAPHFKIESLVVILKASQIKI